RCILSLFPSSQNISARPYRRRYTNFLAAISATYCSGGMLRFSEGFLSFSEFHLFDYPNHHFN
ncbi:hypothetical protein CFP56_021564, partial [Quercus suber]